MLRGELSFSNARLLLSIKDPNLRERVSQDIDEDTTVKQTLSLVKPEDNMVTRVTTENNSEEINVKDLAAYDLLVNNERVPLARLLQAYAQDLKRLRRF